MPPTHTPRPEKARAIGQAATRVFGRDGYTRASIDAIAKEAGVSTRTIYNHFPEGKAQLFAEVIRFTSAQVARTHIDLIDRHLGRRSVDLESDLAGLALDLAASATQEEVAPHFALVRQIIAEAEHLPPDVLAEWRRIGPGSVGRALADRLADLSSRGLLDVPDPALAARHFLQLTSAELTQRSFYGVFPVSDAEAETVVAAGVHAFLRVYAPAKTRVETA
ncbi:TetR/AcrR family transcriptional regulator [Phaeacidiphilus oryzae]|uniref:TetR/AcrR family transcriptional regulator n=1 Tax=Phaeacidiphilus oryzae TaxID=348818 RepID=UPI00056CC65F|nr:TetR/AcrR family transcriptional regulator [Phaeacidiphilus oryzae]